MNADRITTKGSTRPYRPLNIAPAGGLVGHSTMIVVRARPGDTDGGGTATETPTENKATPWKLIAAVGLMAFGAGFLGAYYGRKRTGSSPAPAPPPPPNDCKDNYTAACRPAYDNTCTNPFGKEPADFKVDAWYWKLGKGTNNQYHAWPGSADPKATSAVTAVRGVYSFGGEAMQGATPFFTDKYGPGVTGANGSKKPAPPPIVGNWYYPYSQTAMTENDYPWTKTDSPPTIGQVPISGYAFEYNQVHTEAKIPQTGNAVLNLASGATPTGYIGFPTNPGTNDAYEPFALYNTTTNQTRTGNVETGCAPQCMSPTAKRAKGSTLSAVFNIGGWGGNSHSGLYWNSRDVAVILEWVGSDTFVEFMSSSGYDTVSLDIEQAASCNSAGVTKWGCLNPTEVGALFSAIRNKGFTTMLTVPGGGPGDQAKLDGTAKNPVHSFMKDWVADPNAADITANVDYLTIMFYQLQDDSCIFTPQGMVDWITNLWTGRLGFLPANIVLGLSVTNGAELQKIVEATRQVATAGLTRWLDFCGADGKGHEDGCFGAVYTPVAGSVPKVTYSDPESKSIGYSQVNHCAGPYSNVTDDNPTMDILASKGGVCGADNTSNVYVDAFGNTPARPSACNMDQTYLKNTARLGDNDRWSSPLTTDNTGVTGASGCVCRCGGGAATNMFMFGVAALACSTTCSQAYRHTISTINTAPAEPDTPYKYWSGYGLTTAAASTTNATAGGAVYFNCAATKEWVPSTADQETCNTLCAPCSGWKPPSEEHGKYPVVSGDTCAKIAQKFCHVSTYQTVICNSATVCNNLQIGANIDYDCRSPQTSCP